MFNRLIRCQFRECALGVTSPLLPLPTRGRKNAQPPSFLKLVGLHYLQLSLISPLLVLENAQNSPLIVNLKLSFLSELFSADKLISMAKHTLSALINNAFDDGK